MEKTFLDKKDFLKELIHQSTGIESDLRIRKMIRRLCGINATEIKKYDNCNLSQEEIIVAHILKESKVSPRTAYRWFNLCRAPEEALEMARKGKISMNGLIRMWEKIKKERDSPEIIRLGKEIVKKVREVVREM